ncbi:OapC/ArvC family zinc-ribbon domain-containing protein [Halonotius roseus]|uniref:Origin-associated protein OapC n=1 Tax=Halonotius roseus TaxID=2511997 RepID=A0A544QPB8_9EURY|nr:Zn-ribbon containing protein [Halonotius roseus]TQQ80777.1 hypothetical protein EWF95_09890 [Halonotius roseus]
MPHQCTNCGHVFPDGSKEMLSGCPDCGGNKFQFKQGAVDDVGDDADEQQITIDDSAAGDDSAAPDDSAAADDSVTPNPEPATEPTGTTDADSAGTSDTTDPTDAEVLDDDRSPGGESPAQSSARSDIVSDDELPDSPPPADDSAATPTDSQQPTDQSTSDAGDVGEATADEATSSSLDQLRQELNDQFESIRIVSPGQYELNLMELYDRNEYIISLREDGRYVIEVPDGWGADEPT